jgi:hypothetical protein
MSFLGPFESGIEMIDDVRALANTEKAVLVLIEGEKFWIPFSVLGADSEVRVRGDEGTLHVARWFAKKEKII